MSTPEPDRPADAITLWEVTLSGSCYFEVTLEVAAKDREQALHLARQDAADGEWFFRGPAKVFNEAALRISPEAAQAATARREMCGGGAVEFGDVARALNAKPKATPDIPSAAHIAAARKHLGLEDGHPIWVEIHNGQMIARGGVYGLFSTPSEHARFRQFQPIPYPPEDDRDAEGAK